MDKSRYTEIDGLEAIKLLLDDLEVYSEMGSKFYMKDKKLWIETRTSNAPVHLAVNEALSRRWYVKKPFDVRAEMLARPNEWVGAFKDEGEWRKVGFNIQKMYVVEAAVLSDKMPSQVRKQLILISDFARCIPIEDVPKEEL